jgi:hypothetical protein
MQELLSCEILEILAVNALLVFNHTYKPAVMAAHFSSRLLVLPGSNQRHILRDRRPSTAAFSAYWARGTKELKKCMVKIF